MYLYFVSMNGFARSEEVVTEPALHVSCCMSILCITLAKNAMFEIAQVLDVQEMLGNLFFPSVCNSRYKERGRLLSFSACTPDSM